jgi:hypothetical protein
MQAKIQGIHLKNIKSLWKTTVTNMTAFRIVLIRKIQKTKKENRTIFENIEQFKVEIWQERHK